MFFAFHFAFVTNRPVWQVAWAHPKFGVLLASCSYDGKVIIHRESQPGVWNPIHEQAWHKSSVNSIAWAPHEYGLILGCASADDLAFTQQPARGRCERTSASNKRNPPTHTTV